MRSGYSVALIKTKLKLCINRNATLEIKSNLVFHQPLTIIKLTEWKMIVVERTINDLVGGFADGFGDLRVESELHIDLK